MLTGTTWKSRIRRVNARLIDALVRSRQAPLDEILQALSLNRLKALCCAFDRDDSGRKKAELTARLMTGRATLSRDPRRRRQRTVSAPPSSTPQPVLSVRQPWAWALLYGGKDDREPRMANALPRAVLDSHVQAREA